MSGRVLVVSHPAVLAANQLVYEHLRHAGWAVDLVVPARWRHDYAEGLFPAEALPGLADTTIALPVLAAGAPQRHLHLARIGPLLDRLRPDVVMLEEEAYSLTAGRWRPALAKRRIPFGVQSDENLDRALPWLVRKSRSAVLRDAAFVAARSPQAAALVRTWGAEGPAPVIAHTVLGWSVAPRREPVRAGVLTVGYAGRFIPEKGLDELLAATAAANLPVRLRCFGDGPMKQQLIAASTPARPVEVVTGLRHQQMGEAYRSIDVLALCSRTTPDWSEQFGRVLVESMSCGRPVIASDSGAMPWVVQTAGGGELFPEGDVAALTAALERLGGDDDRRLALGRAGQEGVARAFSAAAVAAQLDALLRASLSS